MNEIELLFEIHIYQTNDGVILLYAPQIGAVCTGPRASYLRLQDAQNALAQMTLIGVL